MHQIQIPIGSLPVNLVLLSDGTLVFIKVASFDVVIDQAPEDGVGAVFTGDSFSINDVDYFYNTIYAYKEIPDMLAWLKAQNLVEPVVVFG